MTDSMAGHMMEDLVALEERVDEFEERLDRVDELQRRIERLEERTDMLRLIEEADQLEADQRRAALWMHAVREAEHSRTSKVSLTRDDVESALHRPDVHRTTLYEDMARVADAVATDDIAQYVPRGESSTDAAELRVDLSGLDESVDASTLYEGGD